MKKTKMMKKNYEFKYVLSKGTYYSGHYIEAFIKKTNKAQKNNKLGIAISVKIAKAVKRNYIKRRIRESYRCYEENLQNGLQIVILWKKKAQVNKANYQNIKKDMKNIFDKAKVKEE